MMTYTTLTDYLSAIENDNFGEWIVDRKNKGTLEKNCITNDKLQGKENKTTPVVNKKVNFEYDLSFLDKL